ncbi:OpgC family protein [Oharaeibacter diazotrophicus]|uniref:OpgC protein n=1 Tax=Oharaeibacter diazotrophicus TaxID=1920512 RepID=A0A4R6RFA4_9HYPH|nr:OpgC domain-containing protein [Oharaeibacter diazotrophicus]TDP85051.1 hypothetical protein EDD54_1896 [Oharaeibacter diazotrophicus]BBE74021.1 OpgC protein [Pleomorphomonas sp. SM30]GLS76291.1 OpgC protein [Oharaeibacter diazotrophicus]
MSSKPTSSRDNGIDVLRGFALLSIFVNHIPNNVLEPFTHKNFGLSDSAELFVLLAGVAAAFAYFRGFAAGRPLLAVGRTLKRAGTLYVAHLSSTVVGMAIFALGVLLYDKPELFDEIRLNLIRDDFFHALVGLPLMTYQIGYHNILPMYVCLLVVVGPMMLLASVGPRVMLAVSVALYAATQVFGWNMPNFPDAGGWFFNPFAWQLIFAIGFFVGLRVLEKRTPVPYSRPLWWAALAYLVGACIFHRWNFYGTIPEIPFLPHNFQINEKPWVAAPRLAHILSLAYVVGHSPVMGWLRGLSTTNPLALLGRNALPVFWVGTALSMVGNVLMLARGLSVGEQLAYLAVGAAVQIGLAYGLDRLQAAEKARKARAAAPATLSMPAGFAPLPTP